MECKADIHGNTAGATFLTFITCYEFTRGMLPRSDKNDLI